MKGSIEVQTLVYLALGILLFATLAYILLKYTPLGSKTIFSMIDDWMNFQSPEEKTLLKAMSCAYYRCIDGCGSSKVKVSWEDENGEKVSCLDIFCKDDWRDDEGKICGDSAKENPVKVSISESVTLSPGGFFKSIKLVSECTKSAGGSGYLGNDWVFVDEKLKEGLCDKDSCELKATNYFIWMDSGWFESKVTILCSSP